MALSQPQTIEAGSIMPQTSHGRSSALESICFQPYEALYAFFHAGQEIVSRSVAGFTQLSQSRVSDLRQS